MLNLKNNRLTEIPECVTQCRNLKELYVSNNCLHDLPDSLADLDNLENFEYDGNDNLEKTFSRFSEFRKNDKIEFIKSFLKFRKSNALSPRFEKRQAEGGQNYFCDHGRRKNSWFDPRYFEWVRTLSYSNIQRFDLSDDPYSEPIILPLDEAQMPNGVSPDWANEPFDEEISCMHINCINETTCRCSYHLCSDCCHSQFCKYHRDLKMRELQHPGDDPETISKIKKVYGEDFTSQPYHTRAYLLNKALSNLRGDEKLEWKDKPRFFVDCKKETILLDSFRKFAGAKKSDLRNRLYIKFIGEDTRDYGGASREWVRLVMNEVCNQNFALFCETAPKSGVFTISKLSYLNPSHLQYFKFVGRLMGKALSEEYLIPATFSTAFYKRVLGIPLSILDLEQVDPDIYRSLKYTSEIETEEDLDDLELTFSTDEDELGLIKHIELKPGGSSIKVTLVNRKEYIRRYVNYKLTYGTTEQMDALREGFYEIVPKIAMKGFSAEELELLLSGVREVDVLDWKLNTKYFNFEPTEGYPQLVQWFWEIVDSMSNDERLDIIRFATGSQSVPANGFSHLIANGVSRKFSIYRIEGNEDRLPVAHTCFNRIDIPSYPTKSILESKLRLAITETDSLILI